MSDTAQKSLYYTLTDSPIGQLLIAGTADEIVHVAFENHNFDAVVASLEQQSGGLVRRDDEALAFAVAQFAEYFAGTRQNFDLPTRRATTDRFLPTVQQNLRTIPYGQTRSYGQLAEDLGKPGAARAVGSACARNPMPLIQPCHRVVRADGNLGEFSGTPDAKRYLLALEAGEHPAPLAS